MTKIAIPDAPDKLEELLNDGPKLKMLFAEGSFPELVKKYAAAVNKADPDIGEQVRLETQRVMAEFLRDNEQDFTKRLNLNTKKSGSGRHGTAYNKLAIGCALDGEFDGVADYLSSVAPGQRQSVADRDRWAKIRNDYSSVDPATGGFLVPEVLRSELLSNSLEAAIMRPRANVITMDGPRVPFPCVDETTHSGSVFGGITGSWVAEGAALPESEARFGRVVLDASKLVTYCEVPAELPSDAPIAFGDFINTNMPAAITHFEDYAFLNGNGVGQPLGVINAGNLALIAQAIEAAQLADTIVWQNVVKMFSRMLPSSLSRAVWLAAPDTFPQLALLSVAVGTGGSVVWLGNGADAPAMTILGRPVIFTEKVPKLGDQGDLSFIDPMQYLVGDMQQMRVQSSEHYKFGNDVIVYRVIERADGTPWMRSAITPANGSTATLSPYVTLAERA